MLGLPINMDGSEGPRAQSTRAFARNLARLTELPIGLWDERLSTVAVERDLIEADVSRKKRAEVIDQRHDRPIRGRRWGGWFGRSDRETRRRGVAQGVGVGHQGRATPA